MTACQGTDKLSLSLVIDTETDKEIITRNQLLIRLAR